jgi:copper resistance protein C
MSSSAPPVRAARRRPVHHHRRRAAGRRVRPMAARTLRAAAVTLLCAFALLVGAAPAFAHTRLESSDPADGASLDAAPQRVSLTFNEAMQPGFATVTVIGPDGTAYQSGDVTADRGTVAVGVAPLGPAGRYEIGYRVISEDGHPVTGSVAFTLTVPGPAAAAPASPGPASTAPATPAPTGAAPAPVAAAAPAGTDDGGGTPVWPWIVGGVLLVAAGAVAALRLGRG